MSKIQALHRFLRGEFDAEARSGFTRLRRIPDTHVRHFLDYYRSLTAHNQDALADASTLWGTLRLAGPAASGHQDALKAHPAWEKWLHEMAMGCGRDPHFYYSVPLLRTCIAQAKIDRANGKPSSVSAELEQYAASVRGAKAPDLRKQVRSVLWSLLSARPNKLGGGNWDYEGTCNSSRVKVSVDYGGRSAQLRYAVGVQSIEPPVTLDRAGFEVALGAGLGDWDFIVEENLGDSVALLSDLVRYVAELPRRLPEKWLKNPGA